MSFLQHQTSSFSETCYPDARIVSTKINLLISFIAVIMLMTYGSLTMILKCILIIQCAFILSRLFFAVRRGRVVYGPPLFRWVYDFTLWFDSSNSISFVPRVLICSITALGCFTVWITGFAAFQTRVCDQWIVDTVPRMCFLEVRCLFFPLQSFSYQWRWRKWKTWSGYWAITKCFGWRDEI